MSAWRAAGLNYIQYSNIAARVVRHSLKSNAKTEALKREDSHVRFTPWKDGKAVKSGVEPPKPSL